MSRIETELFSKIKELYDMKIWEFLSEYHLIGLGLPGRKDPFYISTIGMDQDEYGFFIFKNNNSLALLNDWLIDAEQVSRQSLGQDMLMIAFEDREDLTKEDYKRVKESQITFRGRKAWPIILDFTSGYTVETADEAEEMRQLTFVLDKFSDTVSDFIKNSRHESKVTKLATKAFIRTYYEDGRYVEAFEELPYGIEKGMAELAYSQIPNYIEKMNILRIKKLSQSTEDWEIAVEVIPQPIQDDFTERPYYVFTYIIVSAKEEEIVSIDIAPLINPEFIQQLFIEASLREQARPKNVTVGGNYSKWLHAYLEKLLFDLDIELHHEEGVSYAEERLEEFSVFREHLEDK